MTIEATNPLKNSLNFLDSVHFLKFNGHRPLPFGKNAAPRGRRPPRRGV